MAPTTPPPDEAPEEAEAAPPTGRTGRRIVLDAEIVRSFTTNLAMGLTWNDACALVPIHRSTAFDWRNWGDEIVLKLGDKNPDRLPVKKRLLYDFSIGCAKAAARRKRKLLGVIHDATVTSWQAGAWLLERLHPEEFVVRTKSEVTGANGGPIQAAIAIPPELQAQIDRIYASTPVDTHAPQNDGPDSDAPATAFDPYGLRPQ